MRYCMVEESYSIDSLVTDCRCCIVMADSVVTECQYSVYSILIGPLHPHRSCYV